MKCLVCGRDEKLIGLRRGSKAICLTCMTINDPIECLKKIEDETEKEVVEMARSLGMCGPDEVR